MATAPAPYIPGHSHSNSNSFSNNNNNNNFGTPSSTGHHRTPSFPSASALPTPLPLNPISNSNSPNTTKILLLSGFPPSLKTRDIQLLFGEWEHIGGGLKIKWRDDEACFVVFADAPVAKRAYLSLIANPPEALKEAGEHKPKLEPYNGADVGAIVASVAGRPRSRSVAGQGAGHARRGSSQGGGSISGGVGVGIVGGHQRQQNFGTEGSAGGHGRNRSSFGQQQLRQLVDGSHPSELDESAIAEGDSSVPAVPKVPEEHEDAKEQVEAKQVHNPGEKVDADEAAAAVAALALEG